MWYRCYIHPSLSLTLPPSVTQSEEPDWMQASLASGRQGLVPANYLEIL